MIMMSCALIKTIAIYTSLDQLKVNNYLYDIWYGFKELNEFSKSIVSHPTLLSKVMVISRNELAESHTALRTVMEQVDRLEGKLFHPFHFLWCLIWQKETVHTVAHVWVMSPLLLVSHTRTSMAQCGPLPQLVQLFGICRLHLLTLKYQLANHSPSFALCKICFFSRGPAYWKRF